jgi:hypothetical protein
MAVMEVGTEYVSGEGRDNLSAKDRETSNTFNFLLLAYLDAIGYAERSERKSPLEQFAAILDRYLFVAEKIQRVLKGLEGELGSASVMEGDARNLQLQDASVDGILFSPPYSFAIDYLENDAFHLDYLGADQEKLQEVMVGLRGRNLREKFEYYKEDMRAILSECARVLRKGRICTIVVGTNTNQLGKVLGISPDDVQGLHEILVGMASPYGLHLVRSLGRSIIGISNTMRHEYILLLQRR